ncbi:SRPBCC family protein [Haloplanus salilacus]|uniref:SRPBCC family protein n=1 Tax=Haloplanus salilacus TaxID=2949994 RepID=UPI0030CB5369
MESITVSRRIDAPEPAVRDVVTDVEPFMLAAGFDEVGVDGDEIRITNRVGIATIELTLERVDGPDAVLAYEQREGIFESMRTVYHLHEDEGGSTVLEATTDFALDVALVGEMLDATIIKRQRRRELEAQFDHVEAVAGTDTDADPD